MTPWALLLLPLSSLALSDSVRFSPIHAFHPDPGTTSSLLVRTATEHPSSSSTVHPLSLPLRLVSKSIHRPAHPPSAPFARSARFRTQSSSSEWPEWSEVERPYPDLSHKETLVNLAILANDAYALPGSARWLEMEKYNVSLPFGWEEDSIGLRGHVFADATNSTLIISIKGTSIDAPGPPQKGSTVRLDRINDNKFFSCCDKDCASRSRRFPFFSVPSPFRAFEEVKTGRKRAKCDEHCVEESLWDEDSYYVDALAIYAQIRVMYPSADIWMVGHSLGGVVASLIGQTFGLPTVTYEAPPDRLASKRLHLGQPRRREHHPVTHVYHTGDMLATSQCQGPLSVCGRAGYTMDSKCRTGNLIEYDTVGKWGWSVDRTGRSHTIQYCLEHVYSVDWNNGEKEGPEGRGRDWTPVPPIEGERGGCEDCSNWEFI